MSLGFYDMNMAERAGFEPARGVNPYAISSRAHSSTLAPLRSCSGTVRPESRSIPKGTAKL